jgi:hypothetical protein
MTAFSIDSIAQCISFHFPKVYNPRSGTMIHFCFLEQMTNSQVHLFVVCEIWWNRQVLDFEIQSNSADKYAQNLDSTVPNFPRRLLTLVYIYIISPLIHHSVLVAVTVFESVSTL